MPYGSLVQRVLFVLVFLILTASHLLAAELRRVTGVIQEAGQPVAARLYIEGPPGTFHFARSHAPEGTAVVYDVKRTETCREQHVTLSAHPFTVDLLPGEYTFTVERGHEYFATKQHVVVPSTGDLPAIEIPITRWIDMAARGWYSGDTHLHRKLEDVPNLVAAEDLHVALPLTYWVKGAYERPTEFPVNGHPEPKLITIEEPNPKPDRPPTKRCIWPVNTEYELFSVNGKSHTQGAVLVLNQKTPLRLGAPPVGPLTQSIREEGAILDLDKHTWNWTPMIVPVMGADLFELANNHVWRTEFMNKKWTYDVLPRDWNIETDAQGYTERGWIDWGFKTYYAYLNCGFRMRPTGGTGSGYHPVPAGFGRVYVQCPDGFSYENWMKGLNAGHSFVSTGPMLDVTINGKPPGTVFKGSPGEYMEVTVNISYIGATSRRFDEDVIVNGKVMFSSKAENSRSSWPGQGEGGSSTFSINKSSWVAVRCFEYRDEESTTEEERDVTLPTDKSRVRYAHTAPFYFEFGDQPIRPKEREVNYFIQRMESEIERNTGVLSEDEVGEYRKALEIYKKIAQRADR